MESRRIEELSGWQMVLIPAGSKEETGAVFSEPLNVGVNVLPLEGRVYVIRTA